jgi:hypothetical protein
MHDLGAGPTPRQPDGKERILSLPIDEDQHRGIEIFALQRLSPPMSQYLGD